MLYPDNYPKMIPDLEMYLAKGIAQEILQRHYDTLIAHVAAVQEAGQRLGVDPFLLSIHDHSKFFPLEFEAYALHFQAGGRPDLFAPAWLHHIHANPHHWQSHIFPDGYSPKGSQAEHGVLPMPEEFALEMVADWMGASKVYSGTDDLAPWLVANLKRIRLHSTTAAFVRQVLTEHGYGGIVLEERFAHEIEAKEAQP